MVTWFLGQKIFKQQCYFKLFLLQILLPNQKQNNFQRASTNFMANTAQQSPNLIRTLKGHKQSVIALDLYPSCKYVASAGMDNIILLWNLTKKSTPVKLIGHKSQIHDVKFSPAGNIIASASNDESIKFWDIDHQISGKQISLIKAHNARIRGLSFSCDGLLLASCGDDKLIKIWSTVDRRPQYTLKKHNNWVRNCQFSPTATNLASCDDKFVHIWDLNKKKPIQSYSQHSGVIHRARFHSLGNCLATCSHDTKIKLYDLRSQSVIQVYEGHKGPVKSIDFHPNSPYLISSSDDGTTKIWNSKKAQLQYTIQCHSNNTRFSRNGDYFITGGSDKVIQIWKTGFYDSLNQNIVGTESSQNSPERRIIHNTSKSKKLTNNLTQLSADPIKSIKDIDKLQTNFATQNMFKSQRGLEITQQPQIYYNHLQQIFEISKEPKPKKNIHESKSIKQFSTSNKIQQKQVILPQKLLRKLIRINHQLQFITKTTQILQARIVNNGQQLNRLVDLNNQMKLTR